MVENDLKIPFLWAAAYFCCCQGNILIWCQMVEFFKTSHILFSLPPCNIYYFYISMWSLCTAIKRISYDLNSRLFWFNALLCCYCLCKKLIGSINVQLPRLSILLPSSAQPHLSYMGLTLLSMPLSLLSFFSQSLASQGGEWTASSSIFCPAQHGSGHMWPTSVFVRIISGAQFLHVTQDRLPGILILLECKQKQSRYSN